MRRKTNIFTPIPVPPFGACTSKKCKPPMVLSPLILSPADTLFGKSKYTMNTVYIQRAEISAILNIHVRVGSKIQDE